MQASVIKTSWFALAPHGRMDARFWAAVTRTMTDLGIDSATATEDQVKGAIHVLKAQSANALRDARTKRDQAHALLREARALEAGAFRELS